MGGRFMRGFGLGVPGMGPVMGMPPFGMRGCPAEPGEEGRGPKEPDETGKMPGGHFGRRGKHGRRPPLSRERLLTLIGKYPDGVRQKVIAENAGINQSSVSELIYKLESDGYVRRTVDPDDKRATLLFLTELGAARAAEVEDERTEMFRGIFDRLSAEEKKTLSELLDKLLETAEENA